MPNKNYTKGAAFERRFITKLQEKGIAVRAERFYASKGITDVWWVDTKGIHNEAQLKYSQKNPYISPAEMQKLKEHARKMEGFMKIWLVKKEFRKPIDMRLII